MKIKRQKKARKILQHYQLAHGFKPPFKVAVDGEFVQAALAGQILLREQIPKLLQAPADVFVTPCVDQWLRLKGAAYSGALHIASTLRHLSCRHPKGHVRPFDCFKALIANDNADHIMVGAQESPIRKLCRHTPGVPMMFIHGSTIVLESAVAHSEEQQREREKVIESQRIVDEHERARVEAARIAEKREAQAAAAAALAAAGVHAPRPPLQSQQLQQRKRKRGPKQPNPLSVKKKKAKMADGSKPNAAASAASATAASAQRPDSASAKKPAQAASAAGTAPSAAAMAAPAKQPQQQSKRSTEQSDAADEPPRKRQRQHDGAAATAAPAPAPKAASATKLPTAPAAASTAASAAPSAAASATSSSEPSKSRKRVRTYKKAAAQSADAGDDDS